MIKVKHIGMGQGKLFRRVKFVKTVLAKPDEYIGNKNMPTPYL
jgi:hypothetical protein